MRIEIPQIFWHGNRDRIMSIDFYPNTNLLITSGAESENKMFVKLWRIEEVTIDTSIQGNAPIPPNGTGPQSPFEDNQNSAANATNNQNNNNSTFIMKNGCCRNCMKAFSKNGKSCLCQVPRRERKFILPETGCNYCGCHGCNPIDMKYNKRLQQKNLLFQDNSINHKNQRFLDPEDEDLK